MILLALLPVALLPVARAGDSADIEIVRPTFSAGALPGTDAARLEAEGTAYTGALFQYERDPLVLYQFQNEVGAVVSNRDILHLGFSWQPISAISLRGSLPMAAQWGSEVESLSGDGVGLGDLSAGLRVAFLDRRAVAVSGAGDLYLPTSTPDMWMGETSMRAAVGLLTDVDLGPVGLKGGIRTTLRPPVDTSYDFVLGSEVGATVALGYTLWPERLSLTTGVITHTTYDRFFQEAESVAEWVNALAWRVRPPWEVMLGVGRGIAPGYGTSQFRALAQLTWVHRPEPPAPTPVQRVAITEVPTELTERDVTPEPPPVVEEVAPLAVVQRDQIVIRDPIQFEFGTDRILPVSMPTLQAVAALMETHPEMLEVVIEGHASDEGSYEYNYKLSLSRAIAIFAALVDVGVHPRRLSCRAMGEVQPVSAGTDEVSLAANRRVNFHIVRWLQPGELYPNYGTEMRVPWTGETRPVPPPPARPAGAAPGAPAPAPSRVVLPPEETYPDFREEEEPPPPTEPETTEPSPPAPGTP